MISGRYLQLSLGILLFVLIIGLGWGLIHETPKDAATALRAQGIEVTPNNFIWAALGGREDNVSRFIISGLDAGTQNTKGLSALAAAAESGNTKVLALVMATLPAHDDAEVMRIFNLQDSLGRNAIITAAQSGNENILSMLLARLASDPGAIKTLINTRDRNGKAALHYAVLRGNPAFVNLLLGYGADVIATNNNLETPLVVAVRLNHNALLPLLINADKIVHQQKALSIQIPDNSGSTPLIYAIREQNTDAVKTLIDAQADVASYDRRGTTPLMETAEVGNQPIAEMLIAAGARLDIADNLGNTPLTIAIQHGHTDFARFLLSKGADPDFHTVGILPLQAAIETEPFDLEFFNTLLARSKQVSSLGPAFLFDVAARKNPAIMKAVLDAGLNANVVNEKGETLLYHAIEAGDEDTALLLIDKGADITQTGLIGVTPLQRAIEHNEIKVVKRLLSAGVSFDEKTVDGYTLAEVAVYEGRPEILEMLLTKGAVLDLDFCVLWAIRDGHGRSVGVLLNHGANSNVMTENGETALWLAAANGEVEAAQALIMHHALIDHTDKPQGLSPLILASHNGQIAVVKLLVEDGANLELKDNTGMTALAHAAYMTKPDVVEYLISKGASIHAVDAQGRSIIDLAALTQASDARNKIMMLLQAK